MKIAEISIKRPSLVIVVFTALTLLGLLSYFTLNYELLPKFTSNVVTISTIYPGAAPSEVENTVTKKIEDAVSTLENVKRLNSSSFEGLSLVTITLNTGADVNQALNDAVRKVNAIQADLPTTVKTPALNKFSLDDLPVMTLSAVSTKLNSAEFYDLMDKRIAPIVSRVKGVAQVNLVGGQEREIQVNLDANKLQGYGLSVPAVQMAILSSNLDFPTGGVKTASQNIRIRLSGKYSNVQDLRNLVVSTTNDGGQIRLGDIAEIQDTQQDVDKIARFNRTNTIVMQVLKQSDANAVGVSEGISKTLQQVEKEYANTGIKLTIANDTSTYTLESAEAVIHDLILAVVLVAFVMLFFLHSLRNALIVMVSIPASLIATFIGMSLFHYSLNLMSLLGLSLVVGILVDDAIVVLENIYRHMEMGKNRVRAAYDATREIGFTVMSITFVIVVVFLPIAISSGLVADILRQFSMVIVMSTLLSLLSSFTIIPLLSSRFGKLEHITGKNIFGRIILGFEKMLTAFTNWITGILVWSLAHRKTVLGLVFLMFIGSCGMLPAGYIGSEFFPKGDRGEFLVQIELPKDASIEQSNQMIRRVENYLSKRKEVTSMITTVGQANDGTLATQASPYKAEVDVKLVPRTEREDQSDVLAAKMKREIAPLVTGAKLKTVPVGILGTADRAPIELAVMGPELNSVIAFAKEAQASLAKIPGATEVKLSVETGNPEIDVKVDRDKMASLGLSLQTVGATMQTAFSGNTDSKFREGEYEYDIDIRLQSFNRRNIDDVRNLLFTNNMGQQIKLEQFAAITVGSGPSQLDRRDKITSVSVQAQTIGRPTGTVVSEWTAQLEKLKKPLGVTYVFAGDQENQSEGFGSLGLALLASIMLVYFIMVALYDNFIYPFVVMFSIPLSVIGALLALGLTNNALNIFTILGMIMLIGLVAKNAIILVDYTNQMKAEGKSTYEALILANHARLRPILMTTIAMVIGMVPIAIAKGAGAEWKNGLAWVIIGGLLSSLFLTLIIVPVIYQIFDRWASGGKNKKQKSINELMHENYEHREVKEYEHDPELV
jgi:HAE1 family hydrophobic/amphiphilic exporter-1